MGFSINENEKMGLKWQYVNKIDPTQEKYDIESLFIVPYKYVDPDIFALYAATDSMMTDKLYVYQAAIIEAPGNERLLWLFKNIEMPIVKVAGDIELIGVCIDQDFGERLRIKFNQNLEEIDAKIAGGSYTETCYTQLFEYLKTYVNYINDNYDKLDNAAPLPSQKEVLNNRIFQ